MTTVTLNPTTFLDQQTSSTVYATAQAATTGSNTLNRLASGQRLSAGSYTILEGTATFPISSIPAGSVINSVTLQLYLTADNSVTDFTLQVRAPGGWNKPSTLSALPLLATLSTAGITLNAYNSFTENGTAFRSFLTPGTNQSFLVVSSRVVSNTTPTGDEYVLTSNPTFKPQLVVDYTPPSQTLTTSGVATSEAVGTASIASGFATQTLTASGITTSEATGTASILRGAVSLTVSGIATAEAVGAASLAAKYLLTATGVGSLAGVGTASLTPGPVSLDASGVASSESTGTAVVTPGGVAIITTGVPSSEAAGIAVVVPGAVSIAATGLGTSEAAGTAVIAPGVVTLHASGITSTEATGAAKFLLYLKPTGLPTLEAIGTARLNNSVTITASGVASAESAGTASINNSSSLVAIGVASAESVGTASLTTGGVTLTATGVGTGEALGNVTVSWQVARPHGLLVWVFTVTNNLLLDLWLMQDDDS